MNRSEYFAFSMRAKQAMGLAQKLAVERGHEWLSVEALMLGILKLNNGSAMEILREASIDIKNLEQEIQNLFEKIPATENLGVELIWNKRIVHVVDLAVDFSEKLKSQYTGTEHLLAGILKDEENEISKTLNSLGMTFSIVDEKLSIKKSDGNNLSNNAAQLKQVENLHESFMVNNEEFDEENDGEDTASALERFGRNLNVLASEDKIDQIIGREKEIERLVQILSRRNKNNPVLIGDAGVGKTAIVEGLVLRIVEGKTPHNLEDKKVYALDIPLMIAGTKFRGQFEERVKAVIKEANEREDVILFIDELHTIVGSSENSTDAANILKPALSRGEIQCIGATTFDEYRKFIEKDPALERRFQQITVNQPSVDESIKILKGIATKYESFHNVKYTDESIEDCVHLSERYITNRFLPDKAIDLLDETGSRIKIKIDEEIDKKMEEHRKLLCELAAEAEAETEKDEAKEEEITQKRLAEYFNNIEEDFFDKRTINRKDIAYTVSQLTNIPIQNMDENEKVRLLKMEEIINSTLIGQSSAVSRIARAVRRSYADLKDPNRPIGSFIFLGPTGVGKTLLAKKIAEFIFGNQDALIRVDMSEYMEKFNVSRLIGAAPGYVGYESGGQLTEKVRRNPYAVILFDEMEKAHPDVINILLQILEEGQLTDNTGRKINFRNTIIILTSNVGAENIGNTTSFGFAAGNKNTTSEQDYNDMKKTLDAKLRKSFKPEFINRIDEIIVFHQLNKDAISKIIDIEFSKISQRLAPKNLTLSYGNDVKEFIIEKGFKIENGARELRRTIEYYIEDKLSEEILSGKFNNSEAIILKIVNGDVSFSDKRTEIKPVKKSQKEVSTTA